MNHTIKGIILVAVITSMLVVGATSMVPIMQNSFAYKKSTQDRQAEGLPVQFPGVPGGNTNTNSADSTSSSSATADNTNNIANTATASNSQEQSACAVAVTCPEGSTTVTPPATGTLQISKVCLSFDCAVDAFPITVTGNNPHPSSFTLAGFGDGSSIAVTLGPGRFTVTESFFPRFTPTFTGDCKQTVPGSFEATGTISVGQTLHCTITNTPPT